MKIFSGLLTSFCASSVFIGVLYILCPNGVMSKSVKYLLSLAFLLSVTAVSFTVKRSGLDFDVSGYTAADSEAVDKAAARQVYATALKNAGINFKEITVCTNKAEDGSIIISKIIIHSDAESQKIRDALGEAAENYEVEIINE